ncbi:MAG: insulinase family protein [Clostridiales bacterium]|nr:insulinase family protein [Clostridiales bacterium]
MNMETLPQYELLQHEWIEDIRSDGYLLRHRKSGARILVLQNDDENKVFDIAFKTLPTDSTGTPHIMEHSVLCGSRKYPAKDPFVELVKGSLNTFLNAMTYPDKTVFPIASCNEKDFCNLMDVYLDAVFYPNIYRNEQIFRQEGWSYQLENPEDEITVNGVVYNEMKGVYSSPEDVLEREIMNSLFPDTVYGVESGGDPQCIPDLKYEDFLAFHSKYYHPSNSYIYFYGNMDMEERLNWLDAEYLSVLAETSKAASNHGSDGIPGRMQQAPFEKMRRVSRNYPISETDPLKDNTYLAWNAVIGVSTDTELSNAFAVLEYALLSAPGAKLKQALLDAGIGNDIMGEYESGIYQPYLSIIAKNANEEDTERFLSVIRETLENIVEEGVDKKALYAGINTMEFRFREADYGTAPKGLMYGLDVFDSWLYDDTAAFSYLKQLDIYAALKERVESTYFEDLIRTYLLDNTHVSLVTLVPERGLTAKTDAAQKEKLRVYKASLSESEIQETIAATARLRAFQETPTPAADLEKIPMLTREDIGKKAASLENTEYDWDGLKVLHHDVFTNGISYLDLLFDADAVPAEDLGYLGILKAVLGMVDTEHFSYSDLNNDINGNTGGISVGISVYQTPGGIRSFMGIRSRTLYEKLPYALEMSKEILTSKFDDDKRLHEILAKLESRLSMQLSAAGHQAASGRALSYLSEFDAFNDAVSGIAFYDLAADLEKHFDEKKEVLKAKLKELTALVFDRKHLFVSVTSDADGLAALRAPLEAFAKELPVCAQPAVCAPGRKLILEKKNEGFTTPGQVQYVARAGNFRNAGFPYTGALRILKVLMSYEYMWVNIRVKGGAYGCMCSFYRRGDAFFVSYRDPHLRGTNQIFEGIPAYLRDFDADEREMTKYIIGAIGDLDVPLTPSMKGARALNAYFGGITGDDLQRERDEVLSATPEDIRALAPLVQAVLDADAICVVGNEEKIREAGELFGTVRPLGGADA